MTAVAVLDLVCFGRVSAAFGDWMARFSVKDLRSLFPVAEQTAKHWRQGQLPSDKHMVAMVQHWGRPFLDAVYAPALRAAEADLLGQAESAEVLVSQLRKGIADETRRRDRLRLAADHAGQGDGVDGGGAAVGGELSGRRSRAAAGRGGALAALRRGAAGAVGASILLIAALHGPVSDVLDGGVFAARAGTRVECVRVARRGA